MDAQEQAVIDLFELEGTDLQQEWDDILDQWRDEAFDELINRYSEATGLTNTVVTKIIEQKLGI